MEADREIQSRIVEHHAELAEAAYSNHKLGLGCRERAFNEAAELLKKNFPEFFPITKEAKP